jgi:hypothetical protein
VPQVRELHRGKNGRHTLKVIETLKVTQLTALSDTL